MKTITKFMLAGLTTFNFITLQTFNCVAQCNIALGKTAVASAEYLTSTADKAFDGNLGTVWNAGGGLPQWIQVDLGNTYSISKINLLVEQAPSGNTTHIIYVSSDMVIFVPIDTVMGNTSSGDWLSRTYNPALTSVRGVKVKTSVSPSWVAWKEIEIIEVNSPGVNAAINPSGPYCMNAPPTNLTAVDTGGIWSGTGITDSINGTFDPTVVGIGTHQITYTISGSCSNADTISIVVDSLITINLGSNDSLSCGEQIILDAGAGNDSYLWQDGSTNQTYTVIDSGMYYVSIVKGSCTAKDTIFITRQICTGIKSKLSIKNNQLKVYPNPNDGEFELRIEDEEFRMRNAEVIIYDVLGKKVYQSVLTNQSSKIQDLKSKINKGIYYLQVISDEGVWKEKIIIQHRFSR